MPKIWERGFKSLDRMKRETRKHATSILIAIGEEEPMEYSVDDLKLVPIECAACDIQKKWIDAFIKNALEFNDGIIQLLFSKEFEPEAYTHLKNRIAEHLRWITKNKRSATDQFVSWVINKKLPLVFRRLVLAEMKADAFGHSIRLKSERDTMILNRTLF